MTYPSAAPALPSDRSEPDPDWDALADQITIGVLIEAFGRHGITPRAFLAAWIAVVHSDAFENGDARARPVRDG